MPNGGPDSCATCGFNRSNDGQWSIESETPGFCTIRYTEIPVPHWTYCKNWHTRSLTPQGPIYASMYDAGYRRLPSSATSKAERIGPMEGIWRSTLPLHACGSPAGVRVGLAGATVRLECLLVPRAWPATRRDDGEHRRWCQRREYRSCGTEALIRFIPRVTSLVIVR